MTGTWRDRIEVHPAAALFPMMSGSELDELAADIQGEWTARWRDPMDARKAGRCRPTQRAEEAVPTRWAQSPGGHERAYDEATLMRWRARSIPPFPRSA